MFYADAKKYAKPIMYGVVMAYIVTLLGAFVVAFLSRADWIVLLGALWLGVLLGMLLGFYVQEAEEWDTRALRASIWVIAGSSVILLLQFLTPKVGARELWFYPLGLVAGFVIGTMWEYAEPPVSAAPGPANTSQNT